MDKRTLLAFALIFLILIGSNEILKRLNRPGPSTGPEAPVAAQTTTGEVAQPATGRPGAEPEATDQGPVAARVPEPVASEPAAATPRDAAAALAPAVSERSFETYVVTTPLYRVEISGDGGRVISWRGFEHSDHEGQPVELVPQGEEAPRHGDDAVIFARAELPLGSRMFSSDGPLTLEVTAGEGPRTLTLSTRTAGGLEVRKIYTFTPDSYAYDVDIEVAADGPEGAAALDLVGDPLAARFAWNQGLAQTDGTDRFSRNAFRSYAKVGEELHSENRNDLGEDATEVTASYSGTVRFALVKSKYFMAAGIVPQESSRVVEGRIQLGGDPARGKLTWAIEVPFGSGRPGGDVVADSRVIYYVGPQEQERLKAFGVGLEKTMDLGWALFRPLAEAVIWIMDAMYRVVPNYGVIIILFSVLTKLLFYPLTRTSTQSMKRMQMLQPKIKELQERYKDNREKQSQAMMELYKKEKVNPMAGCLPLLLQMPVFIALYQALAHTIALRNTPFVLWINDLSQPDHLFLLPFALPFLGSWFNLLPIFMSASMWVQTKLTPTGTAGGQMAAMNTFMPVIFLFMFYQMPSGLVLYWLVNNLMTIYQTWRIHQTVPSAGGAQAA